MSKITAVGYVGLKVSDVPAWTELAGNVLGLEVVPTDTDTVRLRIDERSYRTELIPAATDELAYLGLEVPDKSALDAVISRLEDAGHGVKRGDSELSRRREVTEIAVVDDPDGNRLELYYGQRYADRPLRSATGARFVTRDLGFGHAFLSVSDLDVAVRFWVDTLGFRISDRMPAGPEDAYFLRCNPRHHSIALAQIPNVPPSLFHIMYEVDDIDTVGFAYDKCRAGAAPITSTLGRHSNDRMLSFYIKNPSGFEIEFGTDGLQIHDDDWNARENRYAIESFWGHKATPHSPRPTEPGWEY